VLEDIRDAAPVAGEGSARFLPVIIPSRETATGETTAESEAMDGVVAELDEERMTVLDLRPLFREHEDPASLYYREDAHWNARGMALAADAILDYIGADAGRSAE